MAAAAAADIGPISHQLVRDVREGRNIERGKFETLRFTILNFVRKISLGEIVHLINVPSVNIFVG